MTNPGKTAQHPWLAWLLLLLFAAQTSLHAAVQPPEKWLPDDTLVLVTARNPAALATLLSSTAYGRLWQDPAMRPFREKMQQGWERDLLQPLERELNLNLKTWKNLVKGQTLIALVPDNPGSRQDTGAGWIFVADTLDNQRTLKNELATLRARWLDGSKNARLVPIRDQQYLAIRFASNSPVTRLAQFLPRLLETQELGAQSPATATNLDSGELLVGQNGSLLVLSTSAKTLEKTLLRLAGGAAPVLAEQAAYETCHKRLFATAPAYAWFNTRTLLAQYARPPQRDTSAPPPPSPVDVLDKTKLVQAAGLAALQSAGLAFSQSGDGLAVDLLLNLPETQRSGIFKLFSGPVKPCDIPPFVPAGVSQYQRWRIDGQQAWATVEKIMGQISPQWLSSINFLIDTANQAARLHDPGFDVRKNLIANLGDDFITYSKIDRAASDPALAENSVLMVASSNPGQLAAALQRILIFMSAEAENPETREFLGRLIYSVPLPPVPMPLGEPSINTAGRFLHYAATSSYVVLSTDITLLEEQLRAADSQAPGLRDNPQVKAAAQRVTGLGINNLGYQNQAILERANFEALRTAKNNATNLLSQLNALSWAGVIAPEQGAQNWMDFALLPPFERVAKHFHLSVSSTRTDPDGLLISWFYPTPPPK